MGKHIMVGVTTWGTVLKGSGIRTVESHCSKGYFIFPHSWNGEGEGKPAGYIATPRAVLEADREGASTHKDGGGAPRTLMQCLCWIYGVETHHNTNSMVTWMRLAQSLRAWKRSVERQTWLPWWFQSKPAPLFGGVDSHRHNISGLLLTCKQVEDLKKKRIRGGKGKEREERKRMEEINLGVCVWGSECIAGCVFRVQKEPHWMEG